ncbi:MAG: endonuclease V [Planctomycetes bacterium]|nr:endonuclease V [Planctomycetota bacterium]
MEIEDGGRFAAETTAKARALQERLRAELVSRGSVRAPRVLAGVDVAIEASGHALAAAVAWEVASGELRELRCARLPLRFPYVPGLLAFREGPAVLAALALLETPVDAVLIDGAGVAHPRGLGLAAHVGLCLPVPCVGVAKSRLCGSAAEPAPEPGAWTPLLDAEGRRMGTALRSRARAGPLFLSPGNRISQDGALALVLAALRGHRLPEPIWHADRLGRAAKGRALDAKATPSGGLASIAGEG